MTQVQSLMERRSAATSLRIGVSHLRCSESGDAFSTTAPQNTPPSHDKMAPPFGDFTRMHLLHMPVLGHDLPIASRLKRHCGFECSRWLPRALVLTSSTSFARALFRPSEQLPHVSPCSELRRRLCVFSRTQTHLSSGSNPWARSKSGAPCHTLGKHAE